MGVIMKQVYVGVWGATGKRSQGMLKAIPTKGERQKGTFDLPPKGKYALE